jgi:hypothetical protein
MKHVSYRGLIALSTTVVVLAACGGGDERPSVDAIVESLAGTELVADLDEDEVRCFAQQLQDGDLPSGTLSKFVNNDDVSQSDIDRFNSTAGNAAVACGFVYLVG